MPWRWGKRLILSKAPRPYRVICLGEDTTFGRVAAADPPYYDPEGVGYVERMAERMAPYYEFINAAALNVNTFDYQAAADPDHPDDPAYGGAFEMLVEPHLEAATGNKIDLAVYLFWWTDAAKGADGSGWYAALPTNYLSYLAAMRIIFNRLVGVDKLLILSPFEWYEVPGSWPRMQGRLLKYREVIPASIESEPEYVPVSMDYLDIYTLLDQATYFPHPVDRWLTQEGHDRLAAVVGRWIRQNTHYTFARPGGQGETPPFIDWMDWQPDLPV